MSHIKGHQDDAENFQNLTRWAQLNVMAGYKVRQRLSEFIIQGNGIKSLMFHGEGWSCWLGGKKYKDFTRQKLHKWIYRRQVREY